MFSSQGSTSYRGSRLTPGSGSSGTPGMFVPVAFGVRKALLANQPGATGGAGDTGPTGQPTPPEPTETSGNDYGWRMSNDGGWVPTAYRSPSPIADATPPQNVLGATGWQKVEGRWEPPGDTESGRQAGGSPSAAASGSSAGRQPGEISGTFFARRANVIAGDGQLGADSAPEPGTVQPNALGPGSFGASPYTMRGGPDQPVPTQMPPAPQRQDWVCGNWIWNNGRWTHASSVLPPPGGNPLDSGARGDRGRDYTVVTSQGFNSFRGNRWVGDSTNSGQKSGQKGNKKT